MLKILEIGSGTGSATVRIQLYLVKACRLQVFRSHMSRGYTCAGSAAICGIACYLRSFKIIENLPKNYDAHSIARCSNFLRRRQNRPLPDGASDFSDEGGPQY